MVDSSSRSLSFVNLNTRVFVLQINSVVSRQSNYAILTLYEQASKQANVHAHMRNAIVLVLGSLRLAPINKTVPILTSLCINALYLLNSIWRQRGFQASGFSGNL